MELVIAASFLEKVSVSKIGLETQVGDDDEKLAYDAREGVKKKNREVVSSVVDLQGVPFS